MRMNGWTSVRTRSATTPLMAAGTRSITTTVDTVARPDGDELGANDEASVALAPTERSS